MSKTAPSAAGLARGATGVASARVGVSGCGTATAIGPLGLRSGRGTLVVAVAASVFGFTEGTSGVARPGVVGLRSGRGTLVVAVAASCSGVTVGESGGESAWTGSAGLTAWSGRAPVTVAASDSGIVPGADCASAAGAAIRGAGAATRSG